MAHTIRITADNPGCIQSYQKGNCHEKGAGYSEAPSPSRPALTMML